MRRKQISRYDLLMRILLISTSYPSDTSDWRGVFMRHLVEALARAQRIKLSVWAPPGELVKLSLDATTPNESRWLAQLMSAGGISHLMRTGGLRTKLAPLKLLRMIGAVYRRHQDVDVYHVNWLQCALPLPDNGKPALITVLGNDLKLLRLPLMRWFLRRVMRKRKVAICPNADWMCVPLRTAFGDVASVIPVSFGIDPCWYAIKRRFSEKETRIWLAVTRLTSEKLGPLFDWSEFFFRDSTRELHLFGPMQEGIEVPKWIHYHGPATPKELAAEWFPKTWGLITLSRHAEGRPQVMLEAMAAGVPIIASNMPAHASIVSDGETGRLCNSREDYGTALHDLENPIANRLLGDAARNWATQQIGTWDDCAERYLQIYRALLGKV
jgi:hypothetical protein